MRGYGIRRKDISGCCPGHDKYMTHFNGARYKSVNRKSLRRALKVAKAKERRVNKVRLQND